MRWVQLALFFLLVSITWFVRVYLRRRAVMARMDRHAAMRTFYLLLTFLAGINVNYRADHWPAHDPVSRRIRHGPR